MLQARCFEDYHQTFKVQTCTVDFTRRILRTEEIHVASPWYESSKGESYGQDNGLLVNAVAAHVAGEQSRKANFVLILKLA